jgi:DNA gyrase/topoisomerase IV subunit A
VVPDTSDCEVFIISAKAQVVRINLDDVRVSGRATQGVIIWRDREPDDYVASVTLFEESAYPAPEPSANGHQAAEASDEAE